MNILINILSCYLIVSSLTMIFAISCDSKSSKGAFIVSLFIWIPVIAFVLITIFGGL